MWGFEASGKASPDKASTSLSFHAVNGGSTSTFSTWSRSQSGFLGGSVKQTSRAINSQESPAKCHTCRRLDFSCCAVLFFFAPEWERDLSQGHIMSKSCLPRELTARSVCSTLYMAIVENLFSVVLREASSSDRREFNSVTKRFSFEKLPTACKFIFFGNNWVTTMDEQRDESRREERDDWFDIYCHFAL